MNNLAFLRWDAFSEQAQNSMVEVPLAQIAQTLENPSADSRITTNFIFHTAFCASTFLSRCLDTPQVTVLREPQILLDAANAKRLQWESRTCNLNYAHLPELFLKLLQPLAKHRQLLIKPINSVNNIAFELLRASPDSKALMMYTDLRHFVLSTLSKGEDGRQTTRAMFDLIRCDYPHLSNLSLSAAIHMSDIKVILTLWRLQVQQAEELLQSLSDQNKIASLYAEKLINDPRPVTQAVNSFLTMGIAADELMQRMTEGVLSEDAKRSGESFSVNLRNSKLVEIEKIFEEDLSNAYSWLSANNPLVNLTPELSLSL